jgi:SAM-dependent methyltransferase
MCDDAERRPMHEPPQSAGDTDLDEVFDGTYAHFWAQELHGERLERDVETIKRLCSLTTGAKLLDIGCGFGRIANRLALEGFDVTAIDRSPALLDLASRSAGELAPTFRCADMRKLELDASFDVALLWFSTFGYFSDAENAVVLAEAHDALRPGGVLAIETRNWDRIQRDFVPWTVRRNGADLLVERHEFVPATGRQVTQQEVVLGERRCKRSYHLRRYTAAELIALLCAAGFTETSAHGEDLQPLTVDHQRAIITGRRAL